MAKKIFLLLWLVFSLPVSNTVSTQMANAFGIFITSVIFGGLLALLFFALGILLYRIFVFPFKSKPIKNEAISSGQHFPLSNHVNRTYEQIKPITSEINSHKFSIADVDLMEGREFEFFCSDLLKKIGFIKVKVTPGSGDQGVDILAEKEGVLYAIQCKCYSSPLSNTPIQEVHAGKAFYSCHVGVVLTNSTFTPGATALAEKTGVLLWDRSWLIQMIDATAHEFPKKNITPINMSSRPTLNNIEVDIYGLIKKHSFTNGHVNKIALIKDVRDLTGAGLIESKDFVEKYC